MKFSYENIGYLCLLNKVTMLINMKKLVEGSGTAWITWILPVIDV